MSRQKLTATHHFERTEVALQFLTDASSSILAAADILDHRRTDRAGSETTEAVTALDRARRQLDDAVASMRALIAADVERVRSAERCARDGGEDVETMLAQMAAPALPVKATARALLRLVERGEEGDAAPDFVPAPGACACNAATGVICLTHQLEASSRRGA